ncbi:MAG: S-layer homology domain-containing protein [Andreesenia angusta]|nr:S-layer homology domain-containing protein [Andreesenia angusta]
MIHLIKKLKIKALTSIIIVSFIFMGSNSYAYYDTYNHWAEPYIDEMFYAGALSQFGYEYIYPDSLMTREECAMLINDSFTAYYGYVPVYPPYGYTQFYDLNPYDYYSQIVSSLANLEYYSVYTSDFYYDDYGNVFYLPTSIIDGMPDGSFQPYSPVTRAQFAKMIINALDCFGYLHLDSSMEFAYDGDYIGHWGERYLYMAQALGIMNGYNYFYNSYGALYSTMLPDNPITRAEAIKMTSTIKYYYYQNLSSRPNNDLTYYYYKLFDYNGFLY